MLREFAHDGISIRSARGKRERHHGNKAAVVASLAKKWVSRESRSFETAYWTKGHSFIL